MLRLLVVALVVFGAARSSADAAARPRAPRERLRLHVVGAVGDRLPADRPVEARQTEPVKLYAVLEVGRAGRARYFSAARPFRLRGRLIRRRAIRPWRQAGLAAPPRWFRIEPEPHHVASDPPNRGNPAYSNSVLFGPRHGRWLGYDKIEYKQTAIAGAAGPVLSLWRLRPTHPKIDVHGGLGTMRYRVQLTLADGRQLASPGASAAQLTRGISPRVLRVTYRRGDDLVGHLTGYFNVPNVFGSGGGKGRRHQTELFQGADCADVVVGAARRAGARTMAYTSAAGLRRYARPVTAKLLLDSRGIFQLASGKPPRKAGAVRLRFGDDVRRGDIMLIDYVNFDASPRGWDHVAVVSADRGRDGWLDPQDLVLHMGYLYGLTETAAKDEGPAIVQFLRLKPRYAKAITRAISRR